MMMMKKKWKPGIFFSCFTYCSLLLLLLLSFRWYSILNDALCHRIKMHSHFDSIRFKYDRKTHTHTHTHTRNFFFCFSFSISVLCLFVYNSQMSLIIVHDDDDDDDDDDDEWPIWFYPDRLWICLCFAHGCMGVLIIWCARVQ